MANSHNNIIVSPMETEQDIRQGFQSVSEAFGRQTKDGIWTRMYPGWDTEEGQAKHAQHMIKEWQSITTNKDEQPNALYLKATVPDPDEQGERRVVGMAIWYQSSSLLSTLSALCISC
jgi:aminocarboxymuconate-semialdehyde decarboxylase